MTTKNPHAQALGRMGAGIKKTLSAAALAQRKKAAKMPRTKSKIAAMRIAKNSQAQEREASPDATCS